MHSVQLLLKAARQDGADLEADNQLLKDTITKLHEALSQVGSPPPCARTLWHEPAYTLSPSSPVANQDDHCATPFSRCNRSVVSPMMRSKGLE